MSSDPLTTDPAASATVSNGAGGSGRGWMLGLLTVAYGLNLLDRQIINVLGELIKRDLDLADWQLGALSGLSFALLYSIAGLPIARLADRSDRSRIIGTGVLVWSLFTAGCGLATSFLQLLLLRIGVGVGEAACAPPSQSLIADRYPPEKRAGALARFSIGSPVGAAVGLVAGGILAGIIGWRWTMIAAGLPGLLIGALVLLTIKDRREHEVKAAPPLGGLVKRLAGQRSFLLLALGSALLSFMNYSAMAFAGSFYLRVHGAEMASLGDALGIGALGVIGLGLGVFGAIGGAAGAITGGVLGDRLASRDTRWLALIPSIGSLFCAITYYAMFGVTSGLASLLIFAVCAFFSSMWSGPGTLAMQRIAGPGAKATALAVMLFINSAIGLGLGPLSVGIVSDLFTPSLGEGRGLQMALFIGFVPGFVSAALYWLASRRLPRDIAATEALEG